MANLLYNLAQPFSDTKQYTQGAIVIYNDRMYEMTADEYTPGPFDPEKFTERFLSEMISGKLNSNLSSINESMTMGTSGTTTHTVTSGKYYLAFRIAKGSDLEGTPTFTGADNISELYRKVIFSAGNLHIYLIKATSDSVTSTKSVILLQLEK